MNEALTDTFTWWTNRQVNNEVWGSKDENRGRGGYKIIMEPILENGNFDCLNKVFDMNNKIKTIEDYENRLRKYCNSSLEPTQLNSGELARFVRATI